MMAGDNDTGDNIFPGINDTLAIMGSDNNTGDKFIASLNDTGEQKSTRGVDSCEQFIAGVFDTGSNFPPVSTPPVLLTPVANNKNNIRLLKS
jgi:hypothetical protein